MRKINLFEAKTHLSRLIERIASGEETEYVIARNGRPVARVLPISAPDVSRRLGLAKGEFEVPEDIDLQNDEITRLLMGESGNAPAA